MKKFILTLLLILIFVIKAESSDYQIKLIKPATTNIPATEKSPEVKAQPAIYELTLLQPAIDESGKEVKIKAQKSNFTIDNINNRIIQLESEIAKLKLMKADAEMIKDK